jgi:hypothetical protein
MHLILIAKQQPLFRRRRRVHRLLAADERAAANAAFQQSLGRQIRQRFAERFGIHPEAPRKLPLAGQFAGKFAAGNRLAKPLA